MTEKQDQRICIKFCFQLGKTSSKTIQMMQMAFWNECMSKTRIKEWYNRFKGDRTSIDSDSRSSRPSTTKTLGMPKTTVWEILISNLQIKYVCAKFIPKLLTAEQKKQSNIETVNTRFRLDG